MHHQLRAFRAAFVALAVMGWVSVASAQVARVSGLIKDETGQPIKGATIRADNPDAPLGTITAATDDKGRFAIIGLARGEWTFTAEAPGYQPQFGQLNIQRVGTPNPPLMFALQKAPVRVPAGIEGLTAKDLQQQLTSAEELYKQRKFDEAIAVYRTILNGAPSLAVVNLQIAAAYRNLKDYDKATAAYTDLLKAEPDNLKAQVGLALTSLEKGDAQAAEQMLTRVAETPAPGRDVLYNLAEIKLAKNQTDEAAKLYRRAADADTSWGKPLFKLGKIAMDRGDTETALKALAQVIAVDPTSPEATQAKATIEQLKK
jgi:tetratricopeptide (TPR) repeat protein